MTLPERERTYLEYLMQLSPREKLQRKIDPAELKPVIEIRVRGLVLCFYCVHCSQGFICEAHWNAGVQVERLSVHYAHLITRGHSMMDEQLRMTLEREDTREEILPLLPPSL